MALIVKELAAKAGLASGRYAAHSLRSGFLASAARDRVSILHIADQSRHRSLDLILESMRTQPRLEDQSPVSRLLE